MLPWSHQTHVHIACAAALPHVVRYLVSSAQQCCLASKVWNVLQTLLKEVPWKSGSVMMFGKPALQPRMFCYMADNTSQGYSYAGLAVVVEEWHPLILPVKACLRRRQYPKWDETLFGLQSPCFQQEHSSMRTFYAHSVATIKTLALTLTLTNVQVL